MMISFRVAMDVFKYLITILEDAVQSASTTTAGPRDITRKVCSGEHYTTVYRLIN